MKRARIERRTLFGVVAFICVLMIVYLIVWTVLDPPHATAEYELTDTLNDDGETIVWVLDVCGSKSQLWYYASAGWNAFLLLVTTVLAIRMRRLNVKGVSWVCVALSCVTCSCSILLTVFIFLSSLTKHQPWPFLCIRTFSL